MLSKLKGVKYEPEYTHPKYSAKLLSPEGKELIVEFDYTNSSSMKGYMPLNVYYDGKHKGAKLAWYSQKVEDMTVSEFLGTIAEKINKKYNVKLSK